MTGKDIAPIRGDIDYKIMPESVIDEMAVSLQRPITETLDAEIEHRRQPEDKYSENRLQLNWRASAATISPTLIRNSDGDTIAYLNTSFSAMREPGGNIRFSNQVLGGNGLLNVLVFLDKNGNGTREPEEEVLPDVTVVAPQNGGQATTDANGYARLDQLQSFKQTDLYILPDSLKDPFWLPAKKGISILPRTGHMTEAVLPVNIGGQVEGTVYMKGSPSGDTPARGTTLSLYNHAGEKIMTSRTEYDGYYNFAPVLPGEYFLMVDDTGQPGTSYKRPEPQPVKIGYDGTDITGKNVYLDPGVDVPVRIMSDAKSLQAQDPGLNAGALEGKTVVLNLGAYHSRLLMSIMWFKAQKMGAAGLKPLVDPGQSYADTATGEHTLRVSAENMDMDAAAERCRILAAGGIPCTVEVLPGGMKLAAAVPPK